MHLTDFNVFYFYLFIYFYEVTSVSLTLQNANSMNLVIYSRPSPQRSPWGQRKVAVAERWPLWGSMGVIWHLFFYGGATILSRKKMLIFSM